MRRVICDSCKKETEPDPHGFAPFGSGWIEISVRDGKFTRTDYCSPACAITALQQQEASPSIADAAASVQ